MPTFSLKVHEDSPIAQWLATQNAAGITTNAALIHAVLSHITGGGSAPPPPPMPVTPAPSGAVNLSEESMARLAGLIASAIKREVALLATTAPLNAVQPEDPEMVEEAQREAVLDDILSGLEDWAGQ